MNLTNWKFNPRFVRIIKISVAVFLLSILINMLFGTSTLLQMTDPAPVNTDFEEIPLYLNQVKSAKFYNNLSYLDEISIRLDFYSNKEIESNGTYHMDVAERFELTQKLPPAEFIVSIREKISGQEVFNAKYQLVASLSNNFLKVSVPKTSLLGPDHYEMQIINISPGETMKHFTPIAYGVNGNIVIERHFNYNFFTAIGDPLNIIIGIFGRHIQGFTNNQLTILCLYSFSLVFAFLMTRIEKVKKSLQFRDDSFNSLAVGITLVTLVGYTIYTIIRLGVYQFIDYTPLINSLSSTLIALLILLIVNHYRQSNLATAFINYKKYAKDMRYSKLLLPAVIIVFLVIHLPAAPFDFEASLHPDKYSTHLPTVQRMYESKNPFLNENPAYINIYSTEARTDADFGTPPFYEWYLLIFYPLTQFVSLEVFVHLLLLPLALLLISGWYLVIRHEFGSKTAFISSLLLAIDPFFHLLANITTMDLPAVLTFLWAMYFFSKDKPLLAYVLGGFAVLFKISFFPVVVTYFVVMVLSKKRDNWLDHLIATAILTAMPYMLFKVTINKTPSLQHLGWLLLAGFVIGNLVAYLSVRFYWKYKDNIVRNYKYSFIVICALIALPILATQVDDLANNFLPEPAIFLNIDVYADILSQIIEIINPLLFLFLPFGILVAWKFFKESAVLKGFIAAALVYLVVGLKAIYFHVYYKHIIIFGLLLLITFGIIYVSRSKYTKLFTLTVLSLVLILNVFLGIPEYIARSEKSGVKEVAVYLSQNTDSDDKVIRQDTLSKNIILYQDVNIANFLGLGTLTMERARADVAAKGLQQFLLDNEVKYFINVGWPDFSDFTYLYTDAEYDRTAIILKIVEEIETNDKTKYDLLARQVFDLEKVIDNIYIFRVKGS